jgi:hypothetical protein
MLHAWRQVRLLPIGWTELRAIWVEGVLGEVVRARSSGTEFMTVWMTIRTGHCHLLVHKIAVGSFIAPCEAAHRLSSVPGNGEVGIHASLRRAGGFKYGLRKMNEEAGRQ